MRVWIILKCEIDEPSIVVGVRKEFEDAKEMLPKSLRNNLREDSTGHFYTKGKGLTWFELINKEVK